MKKHAAPIAAATLLILPMLYVGSYLALVVPGGYCNGGRLNISTTIRPPKYRAGDQLAKTVFWPLEQIDRKVRPGAWEEIHLEMVLDFPGPPSSKIVIQKPNTTE
jgi:hypothetical protein